MRIPRRSALMLAASAATLSMALSVPGAALADPPPNNADVPSISTTAPQPTEVPGGDTTAPAPETSDELYPGPADPPASEAPSQSSTVPETGAPGSEVPSSEAPEESSAPRSSESAKPAPDRQARMAVAAGCQTYPPTTFQVCGRIRDKYNQTGGPTGFLLLPKSNELTNPGNTGKRSEFLGGNIYWSAATDAHPVAHDFLTKWGDYGYESGHMKYPTTDEIVMTGGRRQEFQGAAIYWSPLTGAHNVQGTIRTKYLALGGPGSALGWPTSDERVTPDGVGRYNTFERGSIYWSPSTGARWMSTDMVQRWGMDDYEQGPLGYPTQDPVINAANRMETQQFQGGSLEIYTFGSFTSQVELPDGGISNCTFDGKTDRIHYSKTPLPGGAPRPPTASVHAWWVEKYNCLPGTQAKLEVQLQTRNPDGVWADRGDIGVNPKAYAGGGSSNWAEANFLCKGLAKNTWRAEIDIDLIASIDPPNKHHSKEWEFECGVV